MIHLFHCRYQLDLITACDLSIFWQESYDCDQSQYVPLLINNACHVLSGIFGVRVT